MPRRELSEHRRSPEAARMQFAIHIVDWPYHAQASSLKPSSSALVFLTLFLALIDRPRTANVIKPASHKIWSLSSGEQLTQFLRRSFPQLEDAASFVSEAEVRQSEAPPREISRAIRRERRHCSPATDRLSRYHSPFADDPLVGHLVSGGRVCEWHAGRFPRADVRATTRCQQWGHADCSIGRRGACIPS